MEYAEIIQIIQNKKQTSRNDANIAETSIHMGIIKKTMNGIQTSKTIKTNKAHVAQLQNHENTTSQTNKTQMQHM